jgi:hypothetical protein
MEKYLHPDDRAEVMKATVGQPIVSVVPEELLHEEDRRGLIDIGNDMS